MHWWIGASLIIFPFALVTHTLAQYGSQCRLPSQEEGLCMPVKSCKSIYERFLKIHASGAGISQEDQKLFTERHCGTFKNVSHVCCAESDIQLNADGLAILKNQSCGNNNVQNEFFGKETGLFEFPWMALLVYEGNTEYVLTAAHCTRAHIELRYIRLGEHRMSTEWDCYADGRICAAPVEDIEIEEIVAHEIRVRHSNDIALIRLKRKVEFQRQLQPICLPIYEDVRGKILEEYVVAGWGKSFNKLVEDVIVTARAPFMPLPECESTLQNNYGAPIMLKQSAICARNTEFYFCKGQSGGPLGYMVPFEGRQKFVQFGILCYGPTACKDDDAPNVYMNVSYYMQWITDHIRK